MVKLRGVEIEFVFLRGNCGSGWANLAFEVASHGPDIHHPTPFFFSMGIVPEKLQPKMFQGCQAIYM